jgi:GAF domain-containing protein
MFARISAELLAETQEPVTLRHIADRARDTVPGCDFASITVRGKGGTFSTPAATSPIAETCDALQYKLRNGPGMRAVWEQEAYLIEDTRRDRTYPRWSLQVAKRGVRCVLTIRMFHDTETLGALNFYSRKPSAFPPDDVDVALVFSTHAASALHAARQVTGLHKAMRTRHLIGVAQGVLMTRYGLTMGRSFEVLKRYSNHANIPVREVAQMVVDTGHLPSGSHDLDDMEPSSDA